MKHYVLREQNKKEEKYFITGIEEMKNKDGNVDTLGIILTGKEWRPVPYTAENLKKFREIMKEQGKQMQTLLPDKKKSLNNCKMASVIGVAGIVGTLILNATEVGKEINPLIPGVLSGGITISGGIGSIINSRAISYIQKIGIFIKNETVINEYVATNPYVYYNISSEDRIIIEQLKRKNAQEPITIENLDELSDKSIKTIWNNIRFYKLYKVKYEEPEQGFQKTLEQV